VAGDLGCHLRDRIRISFEQDDRGPFPGHLQRDRATQALAGTADNADLILQQSHSDLHTLKL
jgi:hypothetical protein